MNTDTDNRPCAAQEFADPGIYPARCHEARRVTTEGEIFSGIATAIVHDSVTDTEELQGVMNAAGYEGSDRSSPRGQHVLFLCKSSTWE